MQRLKVEFETQLDQLDPNAWLGEIDDMCEELGFFEQLGEKHFAAFIEAGNTLLVTFEDILTVQDCLPGAEPRGFNFSRNEGWSHLALLSKGPSWFRDPAIFDFFDRMTDDGFFDDFETVIFHGANGGAYAAAAFSVAAPGAHVVALRPQATLDPRVTGWDHRYRDMRRTDFHSRYGYAPDMIEGAGHVYVAYDPVQHLDASHAMLFKKPNVTFLPCPLIGADLDLAFDRMAIHHKLLHLVKDGTLDSRRFAQLLRARRYDQNYARKLVSQLIRKRHKRLARHVCNYMLRRGENPFFTQMLQKLDREEAA